MTTTRRDFIKFMATATGLGILGNPNPAVALEEMRVLPVRADKASLYKTRQDELREPSAYYEFRGTVFAAYPIINMGKNDGPLALIYRANGLYNPGKKIKGDLASRALDLFNMINVNNADSGYNLQGLAENTITKVTVPKVPPTPPLRIRQYQVPVVFSDYKSLDDVLARYRR